MEKKIGGLFWIGEIGMDEIGTRASLSLPEGLDADNSVSRLILSNSLLYNLCFFA